MVVTVVIVMVTWAIMVCVAFVVMVWLERRKRQPLDDVEKGIEAENVEKGSIEAKDLEKGIEAKGDATSIARNSLSQRVASMHSSVASDATYESGVAKLRARFKALFRTRADDDDDQSEAPASPTREFERAGVTGGQGAIELHVLPRGRIQKTSTLPYPKQIDDNIPEIMEEIELGEVSKVKGTKKDAVPYPKESGDNIPG
ncbi:hypothetical protein F5Y18DRAFT_425462 [Xylariaceae sp. FL1019]|nr:hypothetical protein F5Y18DRAFT_425462 [Xylariaceae sp. FL1019]